MLQFIEEQTIGYKARTIKNASADATIAIAKDFNTPGEILTKRSVKGLGKCYIALDYNNIDLSLDRISRIVRLLNKCNAKTINFAGNGIYTLQEDQAICNKFVLELLISIINHPELVNKITLIRSGGQTGIDEAGICAALQCNISALVLAPKNWLFRDINHIDIYNEQLFKARFDSYIL